MSDEKKSAKVLTGSKCVVKIGGKEVGILDGGPVFIEDIDLSSFGKPVTFKSDGRLWSEIVTDIIDEEKSAKEFMKELKKL